MIADLNMSSLPCTHTLLLKFHFSDGWTVITGLLRRHLVCKFCWTKGIY